MPEPTPEHRPSLEPYVTFPPTARLILLSWMAEREARALGEAVKRYAQSRNAREGVAR